ncbi:MAG: phenylalanine--tRNA ligase subunit alpha [Candidatus Aenigmatarchaeota archaeon]|nr:phenylalanine--tRNA ligase subunit alpha [Candidatus Aenigmarchaeota archaeon]
MVQKYELTQEGKEYLKKGLPEKQLVEILNKQPMKSLSFDEAKKSIGNFYIGLQWALKNKWIESYGKDLVLIKYPGKIPEQEALEKIERGEEVEQNLVNILLQRKLIRKIVVSEADKLIGKEVTTLTPQLLKSGLWKQVKFKKYDVNIPVPKVYPGKLHPYRQIIEEVREKLIGLGFVEAKGPLVELNFWNADALFMPSDHPARGIHDIFIVKEPKQGKVIDENLWKRVEETHNKGWITGSRGWGNWNFELAKRLILRSQTTAVSARTLSKLKRDDLPYKMFVIDRNFRPDVIDSKHFIEFDQCEGIVVGEELNFKNLLGYLKEIAETFGAERVRFKPSYFPFTEPSVEGIAFIKDLGWTEFGGAGIFRPEVTYPLGIEVPVLAWGLGIGRLAMIKLGISDIRYLYSDNLSWLRNKEMVR